MTAPMPNTTPGIINVIKPLTEVTEAMRIWSEIKNLDLNMFALKNQYVEKFCTPYFEMDNNRLFLVPKSASVLPHLENALSIVNNKAARYKVEQSKTFLIIERNNV
jgi:hypothetical protein